MKQVFKIQVNQIMHYFINHYKIQFSYDQAGASAERAVNNQFTRLISQMVKDADAVSFVDLALKTLNL